MKIILFGINSLYIIKNIVNTKITPEPKSGSNIIRPNINIIIIEYKNNFLVLLKALGSLLKYFAVKRINVTFTSSEGWKDKIPIPIQLLAPFRFIPIPGISTIRSNNIDIKNNKLVHFFNFL